MKILISVLLSSILMMPVSLGAVNSDKSSPVSDPLAADIARLEQARGLFKNDSVLAVAFLDSFANEAQKHKQPELETYVYYYRGVFFKTQSQLGEAVTTLNLALKQAKKLNLTKLAAWCYRDLGAIATLRGDNHTALDKYLQAITLAEEVDDYRLMGACYSLIGNIFRVLGDFYSAIEYILLAEANYQSANFVEGSAWVAYTLGLTYKDLDLFADAKQYLEKSLRLYEGLADYNPDSLGHAICFDQLGSIAFEQGNFDAARSMFTRSNVIYHRSKNYYGMIRSYKNLAKLAFASEEYASSIDFLKEAQAINVIQEDVNSKAVIYEYLGKDLYAMGYHQAGIDSMEKGLKFATLTRQRHIEYGLYGSLADLYYQDGDLERAITYFKMQSALGDSLKAKSGRGRISELTQIYEGEQRRQRIHDLEMENQLSSLKLEKQRTTQQIFVLGMLASFVFIAFLIALYNSKRKALLNKEQSEKRFRAMIENLPIPIAVNSGNEIEFFNEKFISTFGYTQADIPTVDDWWLAAYPDEEYRQIVQKSWESALDEAAQNRSELRMQEWTVHAKDGSQRICEFYMMPMDNSSLIVMLDITSRHEAEATRLALEKKLLQSQKLESIGTMVGGVAHEFNNILQSMFLYSELVGDRLPDDELLKEDFQHIVEDALRAKQIVERILTFSRQGTVDPKPLAIHGIVRDALEFEESIMPRHIEMNHDLDKGVGEILCDKTQIHQIVLNLCNNAIQAIGDKPGNIHVKLTATRGPIMQGSEPQNLLKLTISDNGTGMDKMTQERIFDPFFTTKEVGQGTGLGLSVIHGIVEMMGGVILVESEPYHQTKFTLLIPLLDQTTPIQDDFTKADPMAIANRILIADDEPSIRDAAQVLLARKGYEVSLADNGETALEIFKESPDQFLLLILDGSMPRMSGLELTQEIRGFNQDIPIILSSGILEQKERDAYLEQGVNVFLAKPWTSDQLFDTIQLVTDPLAEPSH